jgi:imidazoleglycerol-phosphate dehydratase
MVSFMRERKAHVTRTSEHWEVKVLLNLDGGGNGMVQSGIPFLDQMLVLFARYSRFDLEIRCAGSGVDSSSRAEEIALCFGTALAKALNDTQGVLRTGYSYAAVDEHLARAVVEIAGHSCVVYHVRASAPALGGVDSQNVERFWRSLAAEARLNLHLELLHGKDGLPAFEAVFKATALALRDACRRHA